MTKSQKYYTQQNSLKAIDNTKVLKILVSSTFGENITQVVAKCKNKSCGVCDLNTEGKSYTFKLRKKNQNK